MANIIQSVKSNRRLLPVKNGANLAVGTTLIPGTSSGTNQGVLIVGSAGASNEYCVGVLAQLFNYSASGDALCDGTVDWFPFGGALASGKTAFPACEVELLDSCNVLEMDYSTTAAAVASYSSPTVTVTSWEAATAGGFAYVQAGTGIGQLGFIDTATSGSFTIPSGYSTALDNTSTIIKILPLFHNLVFLAVGTSTVGTRLSTQAAAGSVRALVLENLIVRNTSVQPLNPLSFNRLTGLNSLSQLVFRTRLVYQDSAFHPIA